MADVDASQDAANPTQENNLRSDQARHEREDLEIVRTILSSKTGRAWYLRLVEFCQLNATPFFGEETHYAARAYGREEVGRKLYVDGHKADLDLYTLMIREGYAEEQRVQAEIVRSNKAREGKGEDPLTPAVQWPPLDPPQGWPGHKPPTPSTPPTPPETPQSA